DKGLIDGTPGPGPPPPPFLSLPPGRRLAWRTLLDEDLSVAHEIPELQDGGRRHEAGADEALLKGSGDPGAALEAGLAPGDLGDLGGVGEDTGEGLLKDVRDGPPADPGCSPLVTYVTLWASSQSRSGSSSAVVVPKVCTG